MFYDYSSKGAVFCRDTAMPKIMSQVLAEILYCGSAFGVDTYGEIPFIEGYYTSFKFPQEAENDAERQAQRMNYLFTKEFVILLNLYRRFSLIIKPTPYPRHGKYDSNFIKIYFVSLPPGIPTLHCVFCIMKLFWVVG